MNPAHRRRHAKANARQKKPDLKIASSVVQRYDRSQKRWQKINAVTGEVIATKRSAGPYQDVPKG